MVPVFQYFYPIYYRPEEGDYIPEYYVSYKTHNSDEIKLSGLEANNYKYKTKSLHPSRLIKRHFKFLQFLKTSTIIDDLFINIHYRGSDERKTLETAAKSIITYCGVFLSDFWKGNSTFYHQCGRILFNLCHENIIDDDAKDITSLLTWSLTTENKTIKMPVFTIDENNDLSLHLWKRLSISLGQGEDLNLIPLDELDSSQ